MCVCVCVCVCVRAYVRACVCVLLMKDYLIYYHYRSLKSKLQCKQNFNA